MVRTRRKLQETGEALVEPDNSPPYEETIKNNEGGVIDGNNNVTRWISEEFFSSGQQVLPKTNANETEGGRGNATSGTAKDDTRHNDTYDYIQNYYGGNGRSVQLIYREKTH
jgi:flavin-dependent dehydrogenase